MPKPKSHNKIVMIGGVAATIMFAFCFAMVPLYSVICRATGISTSVPSSEWKKGGAKATAGKNADKTRTVEVQFVAVKNLDLPWDFYPKTKTVKVHPGENVKINFFAKNKTNKRMTVQAIPSMTPTNAVSHFHKIECFCFNQQTLKAGASKDMGLFFNVDKNIPKDVHVITLAYTLFDVSSKQTKKG